MTRDVLIGRESEVLAWLKYLCEFTKARHHQRKVHQHRHHQRKEPRHHLRPKVRRLLRRQRHLQRQPRLPQLRPRRKLRRHPRPPKVIRSPLFAPFASITIKHFVQRRINQMLLLYPPFITRWNSAQFFFDQFFSLSFYENSNFCNSILALLRKANGGYFSFIIFLFFSLSLCLYLVDFFNPPFFQLNF